MSENLSSLCAEFTEKLASSAPVPGGGGAAAMGGSLAASLCAMAAVLSVEKKSCAANKEEIQRILDEAEALRKELLSLIDADAEADHDHDGSRADHGTHHGKQGAQLAPPKVGGGHADQINPSHRRPPKRLLCAFWRARSGW